jgi:hypothetical protein
MLMSFVSEMLSMRKYFEFLTPKICQKQKTKPLCGKRISILDYIVR